MAGFCSVVDKARQFADEATDYANRAMNFAGEVQQFSIEVPDYIDALSEIGGMLSLAQRLKTSVDAP